MHSFSGQKGSKVGPPKMKILKNLQVYQISKDFDNF